MSADDKAATCACEKLENLDKFDEESQDIRDTRGSCDDDICAQKRSKPARKVSFPDDNHIVTEYFEPANPWQDVPPINRAQLAAEYLESCRKHNTPPIDSVLQQIRELPENCIGGGCRAPRLTLSECWLLGAAAADALEAVLRRAQFARLELHHAAFDDEAAEALFDMVEYYESAVALSICGPRQFGIRGWQAASRMIKKSSQLSELEISEHPLEAGHAPVLARALHAHTCRLRVLCLQRANLAGEPLLCLVISLKSNSSVRELRLGDNRLTASDAAQLAALLRNNTRLQLLDLSNNFIQDTGLGHIADALVDQSSHTPPSATTSPLSPHLFPYSAHDARGLAVLVLWNNQLTRNCAQHLGKALRSSSSLCVMNIGRNAVGAEVLRAVASARNCALVSLGLQAARLAHDAAGPVAELIKAHTKLQRLDLRDNKLGSQGLQAIVGAMHENTTITQIDLDDPIDSPNHLSSDCESATIAKLTLEIRALCKRNEPASVSPERRAHRKISLTCHSNVTRIKSPCLAAEEERRRLRSPLPSPAASPRGSPVPHPHGSHASRFSVTRVTPDRESSTESSSPTAPARTTSPGSRFRVVQVAEPPSIHVQSAGETPRRPSSRFSVTRNYDSIYNPSIVTPPSSPAPEMSPKSSDESENEGTAKQRGDSDVRGDHDSPKTVSDNKDTNKNKGSDKMDDNVKEIIVVSDAKNKSDDSVNDNVVVSSDKGVLDNKSDKNSDKYHDKTEQLSHSEVVEPVGDDNVVKTETTLVKNSTDVSDTDKVDVQVEVTVKTESLQSAKVHNNQKNELVNVENVANIKEKKDGTAMKQIEAITEDLGNLIQEMRVLSTKTAVLTRKDSKFKNDCTQTEVIDVNSKIDSFNDVPANFIRDNVVLKKNKSESSLDSPDLEVSRLMNKKLVGSPFCDSSSSLEISSSSMESLNAIDNQQNVVSIPKTVIIEDATQSDTELDRRKLEHVTLSTESSIESNTSEATPINSGHFLNLSVSSNESVSPIIFGKNKKIHGSLSSLEASVSSLESARQEKVMVTSADSGIEYSLQHPTECKDENSSNEGTLTNNSSLNIKDNPRKDFSVQQDTLTASPKRTSSLLDVPALKTKGLDRMRKISWVAPSSSFHVPRPEPEKSEMKLPSHLEKLLSLFQHPTSLFSRNANEEEKKSASNTPPRKDSSLTSSFWSWGSNIEREKEEKMDDKDSSEESTLSERVQVSFVDESFSKKLDSKTPSTDTETTENENTLSEFQSPMQGTSEASDASNTERVTDATTDENLVQTVDLSLKCVDGTGLGEHQASDNIDLIKPNDTIRNAQEIQHEDTSKPPVDTQEVTEKVENIGAKVEPIRPRSFAAVLKSSGSENSLDKQPSPDTGQLVDKLPSKVIRGIKENISPENTLTSSMSNTKALASELSERHVKCQTVAIWDSHVEKPDIEAKAPIATIEETIEIENIQDYDEIKFIDEKNVSTDSGVTLESVNEETKKFETKITEPEESIDLGKDALSYLIYENRDFDPDVDQAAPNIREDDCSLAQELKDAEIKEKMLDISPELVIDEEAIEVPEVFKDLKGLRTSPIIPERAKLKKSNSLEDISKEKDGPKAKTIAFKIPECSTARDIPERRTKLRSRSGSSPKSLPECLSKQFTISKTDLPKKKKKVSSLGKIARDSLLALNMTEEEIAEFRRSYKLTSVESLRSLESVSEDANSQSGTSVDSRCRSCLRLSQESLMSLDSINEDCRCLEECQKAEKAGRSLR